MTKSNKSILLTGMAGAGNVVGIVVAVKRKSGFWGGVGWFLVGGLAGAAAGYIIASVLPDTPEVEVPAANQAQVKPVGSYI